MSEIHAQFNVAPAFSLAFDPQTQAFRLELEGEAPFVLQEGRILMDNGEEKPFSALAAEPPEVKIWEKGRGAGLDVCYKNVAGLDFICRVWLPAGRPEIMAEWIPLTENEAAADGSRPTRIYWPRPELFTDGYSVLPLQQGELLPRDWPTEVSKLPFDGQFCTASAYMPWIGQVAATGRAWQMIAETPWDGGYRIVHPAGGPTAEFDFYWLPILGRWAGAADGRRICRLYYAAKAQDYNVLAKRYRRYVKETGHFKSLRQKAEQNPTVSRLIGASIVHMGIKTHVAEDSSFFDPADPEKNNSLVTFAEREAQIRELVKLGAGKFYFHVDGWAEPGYDNKHPDILPVCAEAGGPEGLLALAETVRKSGCLIGLHDQYRDYYFAADSFDENEAVTDAAGHHPEHARWAGGRQTYLCGRLAPDYVKRNFAELFKLGLRPDCSYLDVFTCNEADECFHPEHIATRRGCLEGRLACFAWLNSRGIVPSSEECTDWAVPELVFCHYGPHHFMLAKPGEARLGIPVPLYNLVYHDAMMLPWPMDPADDTHEDYMLYALLNAGMPYLIREAAYPGIDGAFSDEKRQAELSAKIQRANVVRQLQEKLAFAELVEHRFTDGDYQKQESIFSDGTRVQVNFASGEYKII